MHSLYIFCAIEWYQIPNTPPHTLYKFPIKFIAKAVYIPRSANFLFVASLSTNTTAMRNFSALKRLSFTNSISLPRFTLVTLVWSGNKDHFNFNL